MFDQEMPVRTQPLRPGIAGRNAIRACGLPPAAGPSGRSAHRRRCHQLELQRHLGRLGPLSRPAATDDRVQRAFPGRGRRDRVLAHLVARQRDQQQRDGMWAPRTGRAGATAAHRGDGTGRTRGHGRGDRMRPRPVLDLTERTTAPLMPLPLQHLTPLDMLPTPQERVSSDDLLHSRLRSSDDQNRHATPPRTTGNCPDGIRAGHCTVRAPPGGAGHTQTPATPTRRLRRVVNPYDQASSRYTVHCDPRRFAQ